MQPFDRYPRYAPNRGAACPCHCFRLVDNTKVKSCLDRYWRMGFKPNLKWNYGCR